MGIIENVPAPAFTETQKRVYRRQIETLTNDGLPHYRIVGVLVQTIHVGSDHAAAQVFAWVARESRSVRAEMIETAQANVRLALDASDFPAARAFMKGLKTLERGRSTS